MKSFPFFTDERIKLLKGRESGTKMLSDGFRSCSRNMRISMCFPRPGRTEIGGNHTDHQHGCALAAAVNLDIIAVVAFREERTIRFFSEGYGMIKADLDDLSVHEEEYGTSKALICGIAARFEKQA